MIFTTQINTDYMDLRKYLRKSVKSVSMMISEITGFLDSAKADSEEVHYKKEFYSVKNRKLFIAILTSLYEIYEVK